MKILLDSLLGVIPRPKKALNEKETHSIVRICKLCSLGYPDAESYIGLRAGVAACSFLWLSRSVGIDSDVAELLVTSESNYAVRSVEPYRAGGLPLISIRVYDDSYVVFSDEQMWAFDLRDSKYVEYNPETARPTSTAQLSLTMVVDRLIRHNAYLLEERKQNAERSNQRTDEDCQAVTGSQEDAGGPSTPAIG